MRDADDNIVRRIKGPAKKGFHRVNWNLRYPDTSAANPPGPDGDEPNGYLVAPGEFTVSLSKRVRGETTELVEAKPFTVKRMGEGALPPQADAFEFAEDVSKFDRQITAAGLYLNDVKEKLPRLEIASQRIRGGNPEDVDNVMQAIKDEVNELDEILNGNVARNAIVERRVPTMRERLRNVQLSIGNSTYGPTQTGRDQLGYAKAEFDNVKARLTELAEDIIPTFEAELIELGAPYVAGGKIP